MSPCLDEKYNSSQSNDSIPRWSNRNPPRVEKQDYQDLSKRRNPPRYREHRGQDIDIKYK